MVKYYDTMGMECVYICEKTQDFLKAHVGLVLGDETEITIKPESDISCGELNSILEYLSNDILRKLKIKLSEGCRVFIHYNEKVFNVALSGETATAINAQPE